jgi:hypothetical protein
MKSCHVASRLLLCCFVSLAIAFGSLAWGQSLTGIISGTVTDPSKAPIAGAHVTITNADTNGRAWTGTTNESGVYRAPDLSVGQYKIAVEAPGFKQMQISNITLSVDQRADIDITMQLGAVADTVTVEGATA